jgi:hypothetical protein
MGRSGPRTVIRRLGIRGWLAAAALVVDLLIIRAQIETSIGFRACVERSEFEMVLCVAPTELWQVLAASAAAIGLTLLGVQLADARRSD